MQIITFLPTHPYSAVTSVTITSSCGQNHRKATINSSKNFRVSVGIEALNSTKKLNDTHIQLNCSFTVSPEACNV